MNDWYIDGLQKDKQSITADWMMHRQSLIAGVEVREVKNVIKSNGYLTEIYRKDWQLDDSTVDQVFQIMMQPGGVSAWHAHESTTDRLFVTLGTMKIVLYDSRQDSPTFGQINEFLVSDLRPQLISVPPQVWHGVKNITASAALMLNMVDKAYQYDDPDHWRVPADSPAIPYTL
ncbi:dTDP-4-dehydrorhamnose 3,5-epimerase family protein [Spirosoma fluviale]|uniref:dTDP-4-dehydrorhamnose 3,5-epimerase n=1 Tax=Spirosoma fluviale TaxID=1597977 RepID=A0A286GH89_9BACT|nr:dTDP-4-dehydrorhamnose 3,5-epimerase family protein [Spirosoma fluviale]SOD94878.1 dTDP-4-dehydrorhamnose 3,5-epimerase [Spirosoma fluviale]